MEYSWLRKLWYIAGEWYVWYIAGKWYLWYISGEFALISPCALLAEPIYMNTQELAAKIAARRIEQEESDKESQQAAQLKAQPTAQPAAQPTAPAVVSNKPPTTKDEEIRVCIH